MNNYDYFYDVAGVDLERASRQFFTAWAKWGIVRNSSEKHFKINEALHYCWASLLYQSMLNAKSCQENVFCQATNAFKHWIIEVDLALLDKIYQTMQNSSYRETQDQVPQIVAPALPDPRKIAVKSNLTIKQS